MADIFETYATDFELNFQPGHSYYIIDTSDLKKESENLKYGKLIRHTNICNCRKTQNKKFSLYYFNSFSKRNT